jgi:hypothetical protein
LKPAVIPRRSRPPVRSEAPRDVSASLSAPTRSYASCTAEPPIRQRKGVSIKELRIPTKPAGDSDLKPAVIPRRSRPPVRSEAGQRADAVLGRLLHNAHHIELAGESLRKRKAGEPAA